MFSSRIAELNSELHWRDGEAAAHSEKAAGKVEVARTVRGANRSPCHRCRAEAERPDR
jgi:hypothetical protein